VGGLGLAGAEPLVERPIWMIGGIVTRTWRSDFSDGRSISVEEHQKLKG
jgi:hypothetical protein